MKILIIEDDEDVIDFLRVSLKSESFTVDVARNGSDGSFLARTNPYDMIIIDYSLPVKNGLTVCKEIRTAEIETPIIFLTIHLEIKKKIDALDIGADDYIVKPFSFDELRSRIYAIKRRPKKIESLILAAGDIVIDTRKQDARRENIALNLTRKEYNLLEYLVKNKNMVVSRGMIMEHVWNAESDPLSNTVEAHILNLRKKINIESALGKNKEIIRNVPGRGYIIDA
ncbi:MAG: response regulator transcription factor [Patescibacteria group bacterium]